MKTSSVRERVKIYQRKRRKEDIRFHLNDIFGKRIRRELKGEKLRKHWEEFVDYTLEDLKQHLERLFDKNMNWDNMGTYWHIDHKIPVSWFNYSSFKDQEFKWCWSLKNLQPMEAGENIIKSNKTEYDFKPQSFDLSSF